MFDLLTDEGDGGVFRRLQDLYETILRRIRSALFDLVARKPPKIRRVDEGRYQALAPKEVPG